MVARGLTIASVACDSAFWTLSMKGKFVLNGAMGVLDGSTVELQRFISNLVLMSAYFRCLWGDSSLLPSISRLGHFVPVEGETLKMDLQDMESAFNLFRMPRAWKSFLWPWPEIPSVFPDGDPNHLGLCGYNNCLERVGAVVLINSLPDAWCSTSQGSHVPRQSLRRAVSHSTLPAALFA